MGNVSSPSSSPTPSDSSVDEDVECLMKKAGFHKSDN